MFLVCKRVHEADGYRLNTLFLKEFRAVSRLGFIEWTDFRSGIIKSTGHRHPEVTWDQRFYIYVSIVVLLLPDASSHFQGVPDAVGGQ